MLFSGTIEVKCPRCKTENIYQGIGGPVDEKDRYDILFDFDGNIVDASDTALQILGYSRDELLGMHRTDLGSDITPEDYQELRAVLMAGVGPVSFDTMHRKKNGEFIHVRLQVHVLVSENSKYALIIAHVPGQNGRATGNNDVPYEFAINVRGQFTYLSILTARLLGKRWISLIGKMMSESFEFADNGVSDFMSRLPSGEFFQIDALCIKSSAGDGACLKILFHPQKDDYGNLIGYDAVGFPLKDAPEA